MRKLKILKLIIFTTEVLGVGFFAFSGQARAAGELAVTKATRITHPAFNASNQWFGVRNPWNSDHTRIMLMENAAYTNPRFGGLRGRGLVWGFINETAADAAGKSTLQAAANNLANYQIAAKPLPNAAYIPLGTSADWSVLPGEENIAYAVYKYDNSCSIRKINVDNDSVETIVSLGDCTNKSPRILGWTTDNRIVIDANNSHSGASGGWEVNVVARTKTNFTSAPNECSADGYRWPQLLTGHVHRSPNKKYNGYYGYGTGPGNVGVYGTGVNGMKINDYVSGHCGDSQWYDTQSAPPLGCAQSRYRTYFMESF